MEAVGSSEMLIPTYKTTRCRNPRQLKASSTPWEPNSHPAFTGDSTPKVNKEFRLIIHILSRKEVTVRSTYQTPVDILWGKQNEIVIKYDEIRGSQATIALNYTSIKLKNGLWRGVQNSVIERREVSRWGSAQSPITETGVLSSFPPYLQANNVTES
jgi:hypothetical protein